MSISALSKSEIPQPVEEIERWRQQMNNGEENSPMLSRRGELSPKMQGAKGKPYFYITLAKESPQRIYEESDASTYDIAFHCMETDVCRDSSDTDSNSSFTTDGIATMDVLEYEVRSASASEDLYSDNSSSGDEEFMLAAFATAMYHSSTSYSSAFADTEESDSDNVFDSELSSADYWVCVKCKNKQNNPMFRYCEKCYQIRKNHFPPRPRQWKSRTKIQEIRSRHSRRIRSTSSKDRILLKDSKNGSLGENGVVDCLGKFDSISKNKLNKFYNGVPKYNGGNKKSQLNSAAETSSDDESWSDSYSKNVPKRKRRSLAVMKGDKISTNTSSSQNVNISANISNDLNSSVSRKRKVSANEEPIAKIGRMAKNFNSAAFADSNSETDFNNTQTQKDSGISSGAPSSQEVPSSSTMSDDLPNVERVLESDSSDDTVCEELDAKDIAKLQKSEKESVVNFIRKTSSDISVLQSSGAAGSSGSVVKSISACTEQGNIFSKNRKNTKDDNSEPYSYGSCIICLSEPKNGVFVHSKFVHLCCCYNCAVKVWNKTKRCPVCNCAVKNVMKLFVH